SYTGFMEEAEEERRAMIEDLRQDLDDFARESAGLSSLFSDDTYIERISESNEVEDLINIIESSLSSLSANIEDVLQEYDQFVDDMNAKPVEDLILQIQTYNAHSPFLQISYENSYTEEEVRDSVIEFVNDYLCPVEDLESSRDSIKYKDYFEFNELLSFNDFDGNTVKLSVVGQLDPRNDDTDSIWIQLHKNENRISYGEIELYYGYMNFDEDGGASDGSTETIDYRLEKVINDLKEIVQENRELINEISDDLMKIRAILAI
ncbi:hypothetical protein V7147_19700, partial [Bacillus sp. JJ1521]|uniref:hypothetical protein n=1 Tax=Bacillus sp. JJ1521 TaxID=3122957 RepID=UPI002FFFE9F6